MSSRSRGARPGSPGLSQYCTGPPDNLSGVRGVAADGLVVAGPTLGAAVQAVGQAQTGRKSAWRPRAPPRRGHPDAPPESAQRRNSVETAFDAVFGRKSFNNLVL